jgi:hypothetical protein
MKKMSIVAVLIAMLAALSLGSSRAADHVAELTIQLNEQNGSGESGTATLKYVSASDFTVSVKLTGGGAAIAEPQPAHIHKGSCANLDPKPMYPLTNVVSGASDTTVTADMDQIVNGGFAINVHKSAAEASVYVSCGDIVAQTTTAAPGGGTMPASGNGDTLFLAGLLALGALVLTGTGLVLRRRRA